MKRALLAALLLVPACADGSTPDGSVTLRLDGHDVVVSAPDTVRALRVTLEWDASLQVAQITAGKDAARMNLFRTDLVAGNTSAQVLLSDTRRLKLPAHGTVIHVEATGDGALRIGSAEAVLDGAVAAKVFIK